VSDSIILESYLRRIKYTGPVNPTHEVLIELVFAHATSIPFENLDVLRGLPISIALKDIEDKLVHRNRGGYCFEQNALLGAALTQIGFRVRYLSGRVWYNSPDGPTPPRTHVFLRIDLKGER
jgi:arylamine N-acetyltransferase